MATSTALARTLIERHGRTYAEQAGIRLRDKPSPLYRLLVVSTLLSARISADIAVAAARELSAAGMRTPRAMLDATWQQRVDALGRGHYRRYDERTATMLGQAAEQLLADHHGDLREIHSGGVSEVRAGLQRLPGIGPTGSAIFCREAQAVWADLRPFIDDKTRQGAERIGLPTSTERLARLGDADTLPRLVSGCVRAALSWQVARDVTEHA